MEGQNPINEILKFFTNEINKKHHSIKFQVKFFTEKIEVLDSWIYKDHNNRLQQKPTDHQNYLHAKSVLH